MNFYIYFLELFSINAPTVFDFQIVHRFNKFVLKRKELV